MNVRERSKTMKTNSIVMGLVCLAVMLIMFNANFVVPCPESEETTITGTVVEAEWDEDGNITAVAISVTISPDDPDEEEYAEEYSVANNEKGKELLELVGKEVEATGKVETDEYGYMTIFVSDYKVIKK
jgi:hypothetical protein